MAIFGLKVMKRTEPFHKFIDDTNERMGDTNMLKNPFHGGIVYVRNSGGFYYLVKIDPIYANYTYLIMLTAIPVYVFLGVHWLHIPIAILSLGNIFWSKYFYFYMLKLGLRKVGYRDDIVLVKHKEIVEVAFFN